MDDRLGVSKTQCSLLILLATQAEEDGLITAALNRGLEFERLSSPNLGKYLWFGPIGLETLIASRPRREGGQTVIGAHGRMGTAARGIALRQETGAQGIIQLGMAFGVDPKTQEIGDVLVSTSLIHYDNRTVRDDPDRAQGYRVDYTDARPEPARGPIVASLRDEASRTARPFRIHFGTILSGAARIHSASFREELVEEVRGRSDPVVGGEMEGVGLLAASTSARDPIWCVVKGISDFADKGRDAVIQVGRQLACRNAAEFVLAALQNGSSGP